MNALGIVQEKVTQIPEAAVAFWSKVLARGTGSVRHAWVADDDAPSKFRPVCVTTAKPTPYGPNKRIAYRSFNSCSKCTVRIAWGEKTAQQ